MKTLRFILLSAFAAFSGITQGCSAADPEHEQEASNLGEHATTNAISGQYVTVTFCSTKPSGGTCPAGSVLAHPLDPAAIDNGQTLYFLIKTKTTTGFPFVSRVRLDDGFNQTFSATDGYSWTWYQTWDFGVGTHNLVVDVAADKALTNKRSETIEIVVGKGGTTGTAASVCASSGWYCDGNELVLCDAPQVESARQPCQHGCQVNPPGVADECKWVHNDLCTGLGFFCDGDDLLFCTATFEETGRVTCDLGCEWDDTLGFATCTQAPLG